jgi:hypothetical protein
METQEILIKILELLDKQNCVISDLVWNSEKDTNFQYDIGKIGDEITQLHNQMISNAKSTDITWDASK